MKITNVSDLDGNIYMLGFMATGKSKVGRIIAKRLGWSFLDTDTEIETIAGCTIAEIFAQHGEAHFRKLENQVINKICNLKAYVVSLGGGAVVDKENWEKISQTGVTIRLQASPQVVYARTADEVDRPLLAVMNEKKKLEHIKAMMQVREPYYALADFHFTSTDEVSPESVADAIIKKITEKK